MVDPWRQILPYAQRYPSPHNSQPIKVRLDGDSLALFYDTERGLPAEPYGIPFGSLCAGVFVESLVVAAHSVGFHVVEELDYSPMEFGTSRHLHPLGSLRLEPATERVPDLDPHLMLARRTSRLPYDKRPVPEAVVSEAAAEAVRGGHVLVSMVDPPTVEKIITVNQKTLFYDLENPHVRREIQGYLRYSEREAVRKADGLSARCLGLPGPLMRLVMGNYWVSQTPGLGHLVKSVYLRSMRGVAHVAWLKGPFADERDYTRAGRVFLRVWLTFTKHNVYLHPFGSVITNPRAHQELVSLVDEHEDGEMVWLLFRIGYSRTPPASHRLPLEEMEVSS